MINTAQLFCINDRIWYPINSPEFQSVVLALTASAALEKQSAKKNIILSNSTFYNLSIESLWGFYSKQRAYEFFLEDTCEGLNYLKSRLLELAEARWPHG